MRNVLAAACLSLILVQAFSFTPLEIGRHGRPKILSVGRLSLSQDQLYHRDATTLFSSDPEKSAVTEPRIEPVAVASTNSNKPAEPEAAAYPLDVPSPILLSSSMVLAIAGIGSVFELSGGTPNFGFGATAAIAAVSIPLCLFLFYASILKATAETEADDKEFLKNGRR